MLGAERRLEAGFESPTAPRETNKMACHEKFGPPEKVPLVQIITSKYLAGGGTYIMGVQFSRDMPFP